MAAEYLGCFEGIKVDDYWGEVESKLQAQFQSEGRKESLKALKQHGEKLRALCLLRTLAKEGEIEKAQMIGHCFDHFEELLEFEENNQKLVQRMGSTLDLILQSRNLIPS